MTCDRNDQLWLLGPNTTKIEQNVFRLKYFPPNYDFRTVWEYNNWMVARRVLRVPRVQGAGCC
jgi:hypothetical protein